MLKKIEIFLYSLFLVSGGIKWLFVDLIDPTLLLFIILVSFSMLHLDRFVLFPSAYRKIVGAALLLSFWITLSLTYTSSDYYYLEKYLRYYLLIASLVYPLFAIRSRADLVAFVRSLSLIGFSTLLVLGWLYYSHGNLNLVINPSVDALYPDYLILGEILGVFVLTLFGRKNPFAWVIRVLVFLALIILAGRGPIAFLILVSVFFYLTARSWSGSFILKSTLLLATILFAGGLLLEWQGSQLLTKRFTYYVTKDQTIAGRRVHLINSQDAIENNPVLGIGYGAYGEKYFNRDERRYPHNYLLEILVETGLIGFLFILSLTFSCVYVASSLFKYHRRDNLNVIILALWTFTFLQAMKSSSLIDVRLLFGITGVMIAALRIARFNSLRKVKGV